MQCSSKRRAGVHRAVDLLRTGELERNYAGRISVERHPTAPLAILNYTDECQYQRAWDDVTLECRGLVVDMQRWAPVALPFPKFFNLDECPPSFLASTSQETFSAFEKLDGSLGILYPQADGLAIATRGSFVSREAVLGNQALARLRPLHGAARLPTLLFAMMLGMGPRLASRHASGLVLLAGFDVETGEESPWDQVVEWAQRLGCPVAKSFDFESLDQVLEQRKSLPPGEEGYVLRFRSGVRVKVKVKGEAYLAGASRRSARACRGANRRGTSPWDARDSAADDS